MTRRIIFIILGLVLLGSFLGYFWYRSTPVAKIGDIYIRRSALNAAVAKYGKFFASTNNTEALKDISKTTLDVLINNEIIKQKARELNLSASRNDVSREYSLFASKYASEAAYEKAVKTAYGFTPDDVKENIRITLLKEKIKPYVLNARTGRYIAVQFFPPSNDANTYKSNALVITKDIDQMIKKDGFDIAYVACEKLMNDKVYPVSLESWRNYNNPVTAYPFNFAANEKGIASVDLQAVFAGREGQVIQYFESTSGNYVFYRVDKIGDGKYDTWEDFISSYKKEKVVVLSSTLTSQTFSLLESFLGFKKRNETYF